MTPAQMFRNFGDDTRLAEHLEKGDNVFTPNGLGKIEVEFTRGLKWWVETTKGTFLAKTINELNPK